MAIDTENSRSDAIGDGLVSEFDFTFKIFDKTHLQVVVKNLAGVESVLECDIDYTVAGVGDKTGGSITLSAGPLAEDYVITMLRVLPIKQGTDIKNQRDFYPEIHELVFDRLTMIDQMLEDQISRSIKIPRTTDPSVFSTELPTELVQDHTLVVGPTGFSIVLGPTPAELSNAGVAASDALQAAADAEAAATAAQAALAAIGTASVTGYSAHYGASVSLSGLSNIFNYLFQIQYVGPAITLSASGNGTIREKGTSVASTTLSALVTKKSDPIANVKFYQGATLLTTLTGTIPAGGTESYVYSTPFTDNTSFSATATDNGATGGPTTVSAGASFTFVYPYYYGAGVSGKTAAQVAALTKSVIVSTATVNVTMTASASNVFYFAYPASYGALTSILDVNNFETIADWTASTANITGLDGAAVSYKIYQFNNPVVAGSYFYSFRR